MKFFRAVLTAAGIAIQAIGGIAPPDVGECNPHGVCGPDVNDCGPDHDTDCLPDCHPEE